MATSTSPFPLATEHPYTGSDGAAASTGVDNDGGASGSSSGGATLSHAGLVAIIVVVAIVAVFGITSSVLFYLAKKREWKVRESIRRSTRKVVRALTPRRSEFPRSVKEGGSSGGHHSRVRLDDVPPTPRLPRDLEKGLIQSSEQKKNKFNFSRK